MEKQKKDGWRIHEPVLQTAWLCIQTAPGQLKFREGDEESG